MLHLTMNKVNQNMQHGRFFFFLKILLRHHPQNRGPSHRVCRHLRVIPKFVAHWLLHGATFQAKVTKITTPKTQERKPLILKRTMIFIIYIRTSPKKPTKRFVNRGLRFEYDKTWSWCSIYHHLSNALSVG